MAETVVVLWTVKRNNEITGEIVRDAKGRQKIVFLKDYKPENRSAYAGLLPKDNEKWECEVTYDTIHEKVYATWDDKQKCFPNAYGNSVPPQVMRFVEKFHSYKNPANAGALIVTLKTEGNVTLREDEEAVREVKRIQEEIERREREKKEAEEREKLNYQGHEVLNHYFPGLDFRTFQTLHKACTLIASNRIFPAIKAGMEKGIDGYKGGLQALKIWPENFTITEDYFGKGFTIQANGHSGLIHGGPDKDARKIFATIYNWLTREENTSYFLRQKDNCFMCGACSGEIYRKKTDAQSAMKSDQRLLCDHCGRSGTLRSVAPKKVKAFI